MNIILDFKHVTMTTQHSMFGLFSVILTLINCTKPELLTGKFCSNANLKSVAIVLFYYTFIITFCHTKEIPVLFILMVVLILTKVQERCT